MAAPPAYREAAERWGYLADAEARRYGLPNGATLLLKIASGESGFDMGAVSSAGARGAMQFMPATRQSFLQRYGVDAYKSPDEAIHAAALFIKTLGFAQYNPGGRSSYIDYILGQKVSVGREAAGGRARAQKGSPRAGASSAPSGLSGALMHFGLVAVLVAGGVGLMGFGASRFLGASKAEKVVRE